MNKIKTIMLYLQMVLTIIAFMAAIYLLSFVISHKLGGWMIVSYIFITLSLIAIIFYCIYGYKKNNIYYQLSILPFLIAVFVNVILPNRSTFQVAVLAILLALLFGYLLRQDDHKFTFVILLLIIGVSLTFSIYSSLTANTKFLGDISDNWPTYLAMYLSIFIPTIMSVTIALTYNVRLNKGDINNE